MSELTKLKGATSLPQLARVLGIKGDTLSYALYWVRPQDKYSYFTIPKKGGGVRRITAPKSRLKFIQSKLAELLSKIEAELEGGRTRKQCVLSHGFKPGYSIITNASLHRNKRYVFNADLRDFFPSINFGRVLGFFQKDRDFQLNPKVATIIAQIACHNNELPQGSPCSPVISNFIAHMLDIKLNKLAAACRCTYSRYADDLTFSTNEKTFPRAIARSVRGADDKWVAGDGLLEAVYISGFSINEAKSRLQRETSRQDATGLIVNQKLNVRHEYYKHARAMCHQLMMTGSAYKNVNGKPVLISDEVIAGTMSFIHQIRRLTPGRFKDEQQGFSRVYKSFLDYRAFYGISRPRIICEGKTDNIYIRNAIKSLKAKFPRLIDLATDPSKDPLLIDFFSYTEKSEVFQGLGGGGDPLTGLVATYRDRISKFKYGGFQPVILIVDNDSGSKSLVSYLSKVLGSPITGLDPFYYVFENLYVVMLTKAGAKVIVEDLFDKATLSRKIDGRVFDRTNKEEDKGKFYGKYEFSKKVIQEDRANVDFSGFEPLLKIIEQVVDDYAKRSPTISRNILRIAS